MEIYIKAPQDFELFLKNHEMQYSITDSKIIQDETALNADSSISKKIFIGVIVQLSCSLIKSGISDIGSLISEYIKSTNQEIVITTEDEQYKITSSNVNEIIPIMNNDWAATLNEEKNGKNR